MVKSNIQKQRSVFAIYPNAVGFGYAFFTDQQTPVDCGVVPVRPMCNKKILVRVKQFMDMYEPELIVLKKIINNGKSSKRVDRLVDNITRVAMASSYPVKKYSRGDVRYVFEQFKCKTKIDIAKKIIQFLPQFEKKLPKLRKPWMAEGYHMGMFDALSLALTHFYLEK